MIVLAVARASRRSSTSTDAPIDGREFVSLFVVLALMTAAFAVSGYWGTAVILVLAIAAEAVHLVRRKRRAT